jgi:tRNA threonylcarbamoyladenosine biosynthesis protein TsaB
MKLLALDTSSIACSVALDVDGRVIDRHEEQAREHTRLLMPMVRDLLEEAKLAPADLDALVLGIGPGSFIGMRIAASVAQGLAYASGNRIVPVSSLLAVAAETFSAAENADFCAVCQDAHMSEVYLGLYRRGDDGLPALVTPERLHDQDEIGELRDSPDRYVGAGFGWTRYPALLAANGDYLAATGSVLHPAARYLLPSGRQMFERGMVVEPQDVTPAYLRQTVAKTASDS